MFFTAYVFKGQEHVFAVTHPAGQAQYLNILFPVVSSLGSTVVHW